MRNTSSNYCRHNNLTPSFGGLYVSTAAAATRASIILGAALKLHRCPDKHNSFIMKSMKLLMQQWTTTAAQEKSELCNAEWTRRRQIISFPISFLPPLFSHDEEFQLKS